MHSARPTTSPSFRPPQPPRPGASSAGGAIIYGALSFGLVSVLAYSIWAFRLIPGTAALYSATAAAYVGLGGLALSRLLHAPGAAKRFPLHFAVAFLAYALCWCAFWFGLRGKHHADLWGAAVGLAAMTWVLQRTLGARRDFLPQIAVLFAFHTLGYTLGDDLYAAVRDRKSVV